MATAGTNAFVSRAVGETGTFKCNEARKPVGGSVPDHAVNKADIIAVDGVHETGGHTINRTAVLYGNVTVVDINGSPD